MKLCVNWLPVTPDLTRRLAAQVERAGLWGLGVGDSPNYGEVYAACADALGATTRLAVCTSVTNPVTRHASVHVSAARTFAAAYPGRFTLGLGRGDSAVRTFGLRPASTALLDDTLRHVRDSVPQVRLLVAASGPAAAAVAGRRANGVIAGAGADPATLGAIRAAAQSGRTNEKSDSPERTVVTTGARQSQSSSPPFEVWASVRLAVALFCSEMQGRVVDACLQLHGGYGYVRDYDINRLYADARVSRIYGGTSEVMKSIIAKSMGL